MQLLVFMKRPEYQDVMINTPLSGHLQLFLWLACLHCIIVKCKYFKKLAAFIELGTYICYRMSAFSLFFLRVLHCKPFFSHSKEKYKGDGMEPGLSKWAQKFWDWSLKFAHKKDLQISLETQFLTCFKFIHF